MKFILLLSLFFIVGQHKAQAINYDNLYTTWVFDISKDENIMQYVPSTNQNSRTYSFKKDGKLLVNQNAGWCGTPPITYKEFKGTWEIIGNKINLSYAFWGGIIEEEWEIIECQKEILLVKEIAHTSKRASPHLE